MIILTTQQKRTWPLRNSKTIFRLEFLNRIDDIILFNKLSKENISAILTNQIQLIEQRISSKGISIGFTDEALNYLKEKGF